jgi:hypothetical protein
LPLSFCGGNVAEYKVIQLSLAIARDREVLIERHISVASIAILDMTMGAAIGLAVGDSKPLIPVVSCRATLVADPPEEYGLYITNSAQPNAIAWLLICYDDEREPLRTPPVVAPQDKRSWWRRAWG